jgi:alpha-glucosidase
MQDSFLWWRDGVIYQVYLRSFADSNGDGLGDIPGLIGKLDYLSKLGVDAIWLSPIYPSPDADFGYDVADYCAVDARYGTLEDFDTLVHKAHDRGIRIILDMVFNHTSDRHPWFLQSRSSRDNPYRDWYLWRDGRRGGPPNNWQATFGGGGWVFDGTTSQYYYHTFLKEQPDLNWRNPDVRKAVLDCYRFWLDRGVDGFRLDAFSVYFKDEGFRDNPPRLGLRGYDRQVHLYDCNQPEMYPFIAELRSLIDSDPERFLVGEPFNPDNFRPSPDNAASYVRPDGLHEAFDFSMTACHWSPIDFANVIGRWDSLIRKPGSWPSFVFGNHDTPRLSNRLVGRRGDEAAKLIAAMQLTLRGTPYLYNGEELAMRDTPLQRNQLQDPVTKRYFPFYDRDGCRNPMQWNSQTEAGFTTGRSWMPVHPDFHFRNVAAQENDPNSVLNFYRRLIALRKANLVLQRGDYSLLVPPTRSVLVYMRKLENHWVIVALNFSNQPQMVNIPNTMDRRRGWKLWISNQRAIGPELLAGNFTLKPYEAMLIHNNLQPVE